MRKFIASALICFAMSGCGTILSTVNFEPRIYGGVQFMPGLAWKWGVLAFIDFPFTLVADTALLPITVLYELFSDDLEPIEFGFR